MCKKPKCHKIYGAIVLLIALILSFRVNSVSIEGVDQIMKIIKFFDIMIPVLAVGALIKYVFSASASAKCKCQSSDTGCGKSACDSSQVSHVSKEESK